MSKRIITISREFGSGGRTIGKEVAQKLGYSYYDKELVRQVAVETGFDEKYIEQAGEYAPSKNWLSFGFAARGSQGAMEGMSANDFLWAIQCRVIRSLAEKEPCVIVGRCADYILYDDPNSFRVFVHAAPEQRVQRIQDQFHTSPEQARRDLEATDRGRSWVYKQCTGRSWGDGRYYNLAVDSGKLGIDGSVELILNAIRVWCDVRGVSLTPLAGKNGQD